MGEEHISSVYKILIGIFVLFLCLFAVGLFFLYSGEPAPEIETPYGGEAAKLEETNEPFRLAEAARRNENYDTALVKFNEALEVSSSPAEEGQILYEIATIYNLKSEGVKAIPILKEIAADATYSNLIRGYAVSFMGKIFSERSETAVFNEIFTGEPYESFLVASQNDSLKNLYEYASSLYPVYYSEIRIAEWYARKILRTQAGEPAELSLEGLKDLVRTKLANAEKDIENLKNLYPTDPRIGAYLQKKALVIGLLAQSGDTSFGNPEATYREAFEAAKVSGSLTLEGFTLYHFAVFLAEMYGGERSEEIISILSQFGKYRETSLFEYLENEKNKNSGGNADILLLAEFDPSFKDLLIELGWNL